MISLGLVLGLGGAASAQRSDQPGTGLVNCRHIMGKITFSPPLQATGTASEQATLQATASECFGGSPTPKKIFLSTLIIPGGDNICGALGNSAPPVFAVSYKPAALITSTVSGGTEILGTNPTINFTFTGYPTTGSFPNTNTEVLMNSNLRSSRFFRQCDGPGVKKLVFTNGKVLNL
jgi:hypothetical protein